MRRAFLPLLACFAALSGCGKEPELPPGAVRPGPPPVPAATAAPEPDRIAFIRGGNVWSVRPDGSDARQATRLENAAPAHPTWSPDRSRLAFTARIDPDLNLYPRNVFIVPVGGGDLRQVTPVPRAGRLVDEGPRGRVTGRVVRVHRGLKQPVKGFGVTAFGLRKVFLTRTDGRFLILAPHGGAWVKVAGEYEGKRLTAWRFAATRQGRLADLGDLIVTEGDEDVTSLPAWNPEGKSIAYQLRRESSDPEGGKTNVRLRRINLDGSDDGLLYDASQTTGIRGGPIFRAGALWFKTSEGNVSMIDLRTRRIVRTLPAGICIPDALAVAPDGRSAVTLRFDNKLVPSLVRIGEGPQVDLVSFPPGEPIPHAVDYSPDGARLVMDRHGKDGKSDLWVFDLESRGFTRLTDDGASAAPVWHGR